MNKMKVRKAAVKRIKVTSNGKLLKRHQFAAGHLKRKKTKGALNRQKKLTSIFKGEAKAIRRGWGI